MSGRESNKETLKDIVLFEGCMLGVLCGDCWGRDVEWDTGSGEVLASPRVDINLRRLLKRQEESQGDSSLMRFAQYTDDTAMTRAVAQSIIGAYQWPGKERKTLFDLEVARMFAATYVKDKTNGMYRGYGRTADSIIQQLVEIFRVQHSSDIDDDAAQNPNCVCSKCEWMEPACNVFEGNGSYGNGGAMRVSPVALAFGDDIKSCCYYAAVQARVTHANPQGILGAVFQAAAVWLTLQEGRKRLKEENDGAEIGNKCVRPRSEYSQNLRARSRSPIGQRSSRGCVIAAGEQKSVTRSFGGVNRESETINLLAEEGGGEEEIFGGCVAERGGDRSSAGRIIKCQNEFPFEEWLQKLEGIMREVENKGVEHFAPVGLKETQLLKQGKSCGSIRRERPMDSRQFETVLSHREKEKEESYVCAVQQIRHLLMKTMKKESSNSRNEDLRSSADASRTLMSELRSQCVEIIGNDITARWSVPTATFAFLLALKLGPKGWGPIDIIRFSVTFGGDTDTIGAMTGALAGVYFGSERFCDSSGKISPLVLICEEWKEMVEIGRRLRYVSHSLNECAECFMDVSCGIEVDNNRQTSVN